MSELTDRDVRWLDAAVRLARPTLGTLGGHPAVAALVVDEDDGRAVARSVTGAEGSPTAVIAAIADAGMAAQGRTLYVTLEPSMEDARMVAAAGFARVVIGTAGSGSGVPALLEEHGIDCVSANHPGSAELNKAQAHRARKHRPLTTLCLAISPDGMMARKDGMPLPLMGEAARDWLGMQRALSDGVLIGGRTAELDDPPLTPGLRGMDDRPYVRVVALGSRPLPPALKMLQGGHRVWVLCERGKDFGLPPPVEFITLDSRNNHPDLRQGMAVLAGRGVAALHVEGGAKLTEAMLAAELLDRIHLIETPIEVGRAGLPATAFGGIHGRLRGAGFVETESRELGVDRLRTYEREF